MQITNYPTIAEFMEKVGPYLEENETLSSLILGSGLQLLASSVDPAKDTPFRYFATVADIYGKTLLAAMLTPPANLTLYADRLSQPEQLAQAVALLVEDLRAWQIALPGVVAPLPLADIFAQKWAQASGQQFQPRLQMRLFKLTTLIPPQTSPAGKFRAAQDADIEKLAGWMLDFNREALGSAGISFEEAVAGVKSRINKSRLYVWEDVAGELVSMAGLTRPTRHTVTVNDVYTPLDQRGKGYASHCVAALSQLMLVEKGYTYCVLFTDLANPTSNSIYQKLGYAPVVDFTNYSFSQ